MYKQALAGYKKALGPDHVSSLDTVYNLGTLYAHQGRLKEAEEMLQRGLAGYKKALGPDYTSTIRAANNLTVLYKGHGKLKEADDVHQ
jgi:tetratricopeptide (TPR) repeat protein